MPTSLAPVLRVFLHASTDSIPRKSRAGSVIPTTRFCSVMSTDTDSRAQTHAESPDGLRRLIQSLCLVNRQAWDAAARDVQLANSDLSALARVVDEQQMTGLELREASGLGSSAVTEMADRLERAKLIARTRAQHDRRVMTLKPTANGERTVRRALRPLHTLLAGVRDGHDQEELERLAAFLVEISDALAEAGPPRSRST
jgi:DNA-binding MarR family transcriptional regulator